MIDTITNPDVIRGLILSFIYGKRTSVVKALKQYQLQRIQMLSSPMATSGPTPSFKPNPTSQPDDSTSPDPNPDPENGELIDTNELDASQFYTPDELKLDWSWLLPQNHPIPLLSIVASPTMALAMSNAQHTQRELYIASMRTDNGQGGVTTAPMMMLNGGVAVGAGNNNNNSTQNNPNNNQSTNSLTNSIMMPSNYVVQDMYNVVNVVDIANELSRMQKGLFKHLFSF